MSSTLFSIRLTGLSNAYSSASNSSKMVVKLSSRTVFDASKLFTNPSPVGNVGIVLTVIGRVSVILKVFSPSMWKMAY